MPHYRQIIMCLPEYKIDGLVNVFKRHAQNILEKGGCVRAIENHGIRELPERTISLHADYWGNKSFWNARYVTVSLDLSPKQMIEITDSLKEEEPVMRVFVHKIRTAADRLETKTYKMPFQDLPFPKLPRQKL